MKISIESIKKNKSEIIFYSVGLTLSVIIIFVFVNSIGYLVSSLESALEVTHSNYSSVTFNVDSLKTLGVVNSIPPSVEVSQ